MCIVHICIGWKSLCYISFHEASTFWTRIWRFFMKLHLLKCWCFPPLRRPSAAECRVAGPRVVAGLRGTWKPTRRWLGFEHSKQDNGKGEIIYEGIMKRKGVDARAGSRSDSMPESVTPDDHWSLFWTVLLFSKLTREEQTSNSFGENIYFNCWNAVGAMIFHRSQE